MVCPEGAVATSLGLCRVRPPQNFADTGPSILMMLAPRCLGSSKVFPGRSCLNNLSYILRAGPLQLRVLWKINNTLPWTTCKVRDEQVLLLASVHGAQDAVETAFLGHTLPWTTSLVETSKCCCLSVSMVPRMLWRQPSWGTL